MIHRLAVIVGLLFAPATAMAATVAPAGQQVWQSPDHDVSLSRPLAAHLSTSDEPLGALSSGGWRLNWGDKTDVKGTVVARLSLPVVPASGVGQAKEFVQVGWSDAPVARRNCLTFGLDGGDEQRLRDRTINGRVFKAVSNGDAGMSQSIDVTDLRTVVGRRCYAVERGTYTVSAANRDPKASLTQQQGAAVLDAALASLTLKSP